MTKTRKRGQLAVTAMCIVVGFLLAAQLRSVKLTAAADATSAARLETLQTLYNEESDRNKDLERQLEQARQELAAYREEAAASGAVSEALLGELEQLSMAAGLVDLEGPGVTVVMQDSASVNLTGDEADYVIHDNDIMSVVNELRSAGAEAVSLNGERLLATSEIRCTGAVVTVNGKRYAAPYVVMAIGDPQTLYGALTMRNGVVDILGQWGISVRVTANDLLFLPKYSGSLEQRYASPARPPEEEAG